MRQTSIDQLGTDGSLLFTYPKARPTFVDQSLVMGSGNVVTWGKRRISSNLILYVATTGNDTTGDGSQAKPFLTATAALNWARYNIDFCGYDLILQFADGTYQGFAVQNYPAKVQILGNSTNSSLVKFTFPSSFCLSIVSSVVDIAYVEIVTPSPLAPTAYTGIGVSSQSLVNLYSVNFNALNNSSYLCSAGAFSQVNVFGGQIKGGAFAAYYIFQSNITIHSSVTVLNAPTFSYFFYISESAVGFIFSAFSGSASGSQGIIQYNSLLKGMSRFPSGLTAYLLSNGGYAY